VSELGKMEERLGIDMNLHHLPCKAGNGLGSDILPSERWECTPVEIRSWVAEAGSLYGDMQITGETSASLSGKPMTLVIASSRPYIFVDGVYNDEV